MIRKKTIVSTTLLYMLIITLLSLINISPKENHVDISHFDKIVHFSFYLGLNALFMISRDINGCKDRLLGRLLTTLIVITYSVTIEVIQLFVGREFDLLDIAANSLGAISAMLLYNGIRSIVVKG